jgi:phosphoglycolate phosphatase
MPLIGLPLHVVLERLLPNDADHVVVPQLVDSYRRIYNEEAIPNTRLFPEVESTLHQLAAAGTILTIASSKTTPVSKKLLAHCGVADLFQLYMGNDSVEQLKPHPEMVLRTLDHFGCRPDEALMVGDSIHDLGMGQAAGVATCAVTYGAGTVEELRALEPTHVIDRFSELAAIVS